MSEVSVVICTYTEERWGDLVAAVASVQQQTQAAREAIVVVDQNPHLLDRVRTEVGGVVAVGNAEARGLSGARNTGIKAARGRLIAFLDDDAIAAPDWLEWLTAACEDQRVLGVGGAVEPLWVGRRPDWLPEEFHWVIGCSYRGLPESTGPVRNPIGANMVIRREVFDVVGGFVHAIGRVGTTPVGCDETELCIRARQHWPEHTFVYEPRARVLHRVPPARTRWSYFQSRCYAEGVSKALVSRLVGAGDALASERAHAFRALPTAVLRGITDGFAQRDPGSLARAGAVIAGLAWTTTGFLAGSVAARHGVAAAPRLGALPEAG